MRPIVQARWLSGRRTPLAFSDLRFVVKSPALPGKGLGGDVVRLIVRKDERGPVRDKRGHRMDGMGHEIDRMGMAVNGLPTAWKRNPGCRDRRFSGKLSHFVPFAITPTAPASAVVGCGGCPRQ